MILNILSALGLVLTETNTDCYAWALIPNHFHLLLRTGTAPVATVMRRLLTGYAIRYNRRHSRHGHIFQNRYKSILCQEEPYLLELVRYIHLNPLRAGLVPDLGQLGKYPFSGHAVIMGKQRLVWQNSKKVLGLFGKEITSARREYRNFVAKGIDQGRRPDLIGGGLIRSTGGWAAVRQMRKAKVHYKSDERILGDGDLVARVLSEANDVFERKYALKARGVDVDVISETGSRAVGDVTGGGLAAGQIPAACDSTQFNLLLGSDRFGRKYDFVGPSLQYFNRGG